MTAEQLADVVRTLLDGEYDDGLGAWLDATFEGNTVVVKVTPADAPPERARRFRAVFVEVTEAASRSGAAVMAADAAVIAP